VSSPSSAEGFVSSNLVDLADLPPILLFDRVVARRVQGDQVTLAIVELEPHGVVPEHRHPYEQNGMVIQGQIRFQVDGEERELGPGGTWRILADVRHAAVAGPNGAVVIDVCSPIRDDWDDLPVLDQPPLWPLAK
jgi:quercetin dioxygenase-like cupin family protein